MWKKITVSYNLLPCQLSYISLVNTIPNCVKFSPDYVTFIPNYVKALSYNIVISRL